MALFEQDIHHGFGDSGASESGLKTYESVLQKGIDALCTRYADGTLPMLNLPEKTDDLQAIAKAGAYFREHFAHVLVVGTGGSSLGGQTLAALTENPFAPAQKGAPKLHFLDNVDPHTMSQLLETLDMAEVGCIVISKSGGTAEIIAQMLVLLTHMEERLGREQAGRQFLAVTMPTDNPLRRLCQRYDIETLEHDPRVGGRFSVLSLVGLIPAAVAGLDVKRLRAGAKTVMDAVRSGRDNPLAVAPAKGAALQVALAEKGKAISVLMPYCDRLGYFGMWFRQLWAESLGKDGKGTTPVRAMGTVDQHSQLQLYLAGPKDKFITLIHPHTVGQGPQIDGALVEEPQLDYIKNQAIGDVMAAHQHGTCRSLENNGCPVRVLRIGELNEEVLGALLMHFMLETILAADLLGIDAYDQPAVEESKVFAREYLAQHSRAA